MIPKVIHYCWFGNAPKNRLTKKCIKSWKKKCPGYDIIEWNERNFDLSQAPLYVQQAYEKKKWAFVSDYARLKIVHDNGGVYLDTDVEVIKSFNNLLHFKSFFGFEDNKYVNTGIGFGSEKKNVLLNELLQQYENIQFINCDSSLDLTPCPQRNTVVFVNHGLVLNGLTQEIDGNNIVLSSEYLCPINYETLKKNITSNTYSIHWFSASWHTKIERKEHKIDIREHKKREIINRIRNFKYSVLKLPNRILRLLLGKTLYGRLKNKLKK